MARLSAEPLAAWGVSELSGLGGLFWAWLEPSYVDYFLQFCCVLKDLLGYTRIFLVVLRFLLDLSWFGGFKK